MGDADKNSMVRYLLLKASYLVLDLCLFVLRLHLLTILQFFLFLGEFGKYQFAQFFLQLLSALTAGLHMLSLVTVAAVPEHRCFIAGLDNSSFSQVPWNSSAILAAIPTKETGELDSCHMYNQTAGDHSLIPCDKYVYDTTYYKTSRTIDWDFVCDRRWMGSIIQTVFMLGVFTGAVTLGGLADKVGRKTVFCWSALLQLIVGVAVAFIPEYFSVLAARFILGIVGSAGAYICGFVLTMELVGPSKRTVCGITFQVSLSDIVSVKTLNNNTYLISGRLCRWHYAGGGLGSHYQGSPVATSNIRTARPTLHWPLVAPRRVSALALDAGSCG